VRLQSPPCGQQSQNFILRYICITQARAMLQKSALSKDLALLFSLARVFRGAL